MINNLNKMKTAQGDTFVVVTIQVQKLGRKQEAILFIVLVLKNAKLVLNSLLVDYINLD